MISAYELDSSQLAAEGISRRDLRERSDSIGKIFERLLEDGEESFFEALRQPDYLSVLHQALVKPQADVFEGRELLLTLLAVQKAISANSSKNGIYAISRSGLSGLKNTAALYAVAQRTRALPSGFVRFCREALAVDSVAIQDGFQISFELVLLSRYGRWVLFHLGISDVDIDEQAAGRIYVWSSMQEEFSRGGEIVRPLGIIGQPGGDSLNLVHEEAEEVRQRLLDLLWLDQDAFMECIRSLSEPSKEDLTPLVDLKRLGSIRSIVQERGISDCLSLLTVDGLGPKTLDSFVALTRQLFGLSFRFPDVAKDILDGEEPIDTEKGDSLLQLLSSLRQSVVGAGEQAGDDARVVQIMKLIKMRRQKGPEKSRKSIPPGKRRKHSGKKDVTSTVKVASDKLVHMPSGESPIRRRRVKISVDQLALF